MEALTPVLEGIKIHKDESGPEFRTLWDQLNSIKSQLSSLRGETYVSSPLSSTSAPLRSAPLTLESYVSPSVIEKEAKASNS